MKKAIIFDMDGLMIDSERLCFDVYMTISKQMNLHMSEKFYLSTIGSNKEREINLFYKEYGNDFPMDKFWEKSHILLDERLKKHVPLKKGLIELLTYLKENNYKTMVATSSQRHRVDEILKNADLTSYFDDVICGDEIKKGKPDPEIFLTACKKLNVDVNDALVLEDSEAGIIASYNANIDVICIPDMIKPTTIMKEKSIHIYDSLLDVITYLEK